MDQIRIVAALVVAVFALLSQVFALTGYAPPIPIDKLLHLTPEQIANSAALLLAFLAPVHKLLGDAWAMVIEILNQRNARANAAYDKLQADFADLARKFAELQSRAVVVQAAPEVVSPPGAQAGRGSIGALIAAFVVAVAMAGFGAMVLPGCSSLPAPKSEAQILAYTEAGITSARSMALSMLSSGQIDVGKAIQVQADADKASAAIKAARAATMAGDVTTAQMQLAIATQILNSLQAAFPVTKQ